MKKLFLKDSVKINGRHFDYEIWLITSAARKTAPDTHDSSVWITSANDSKHKVNSKHYSSEAFDIRTRNLIGGDVAARKWVEDMKRELGRNYDVIFEGDHIHVEFDPKV